MNSCHSLLVVCCYSELQGTQKPLMKHLFRAPAHPRPRGNITKAFWQAADLCKSMWTRDTLTKSNLTHIHTKWPIKDGTEKLHFCVCVCMCVKVEKLE